MEPNVQMDMLRNALDGISLNDANQLYDQVIQLTAQTNAVIREGLAAQTVHGRILHPSIPAIYGLAWQFIRRYTGLGLPTPAELSSGHVTKTANVVNFKG